MHILKCALFLSIVISVDPDKHNIRATEPKTLKNDVHSRPPTNFSLLNPRARHSTNPSSFRVQVPSDPVDSPRLSNRFQRNDLHSRPPINPSLLNPRARHFTNPSSFRVQVPSDPVDSPRLSNRFQRNADKSFVEFVDHISIIARLANSIKMQSDLMSGRDMKYKVGELLNIGKIDVDALKRINTPRLMELMQVIHKTKENLVDVRKEEERMELWEEIQKVIVDLGEVKDFPNREEFLFKDAQSLYDKFSQYRFDNAWPAVRDLLESLKVLKGYLTRGHIRKEEVPSYVNELTTIKQKIGYAISRIDSLESQMTDLEPFRSWDLEQKRSVLFKPERLLAAVSYRNAVRNLDLTSDEKKNNLDKNYGIVDDMKESVKNFKDDFKLFVDTLLNYSINPFLDLKGFEAITLLADEINNKRFKDIFKWVDDEKKLINRLQPIFKIRTTKLANSNFSSDLHTQIAIEKVNLILNEFLKRPTSAKGLAQLLGTFESCGAKGSVNDADMIAYARYPLMSGQELLENFAYLWSRESLHINELQSNLDDLKSVEKTLSTINLDDRTTTEQLSSVFTGLVTNGTLNRVQKSMTTLLRTSSEFDAKSLKEALKQIVTYRNNTEDFLKMPEVLNEYNVHTCLKPFKDQCTNAHEATLMIRMMRLLGVESINSVNNYFDQVAKVQKTVDSFKSIPRLMKESLSAEVEKLNRIDTSVVTRIEKAVISIRNIVVIKNIGLLEVLRNIQKQATTDLNLISIYGPKLLIYREIKELWPLREVILSLEHGLEYFDDQLKDFNFHKLNNLSDYDTFFEKLKDMPDIKIKPKSLIKALNRFIKETPWENHIDKYTKTKAELIKISSIDLDFAKNFKEVGDAFQKFENFLTQALADDVVNPMQDQDSQEKDENDYTWILVGCVVFVACLSAMGVFVLWKKKLLCFKRKRKSVECDVIDMDPVDNKPVLTPDLIIVAIAQQTFGRHPEHYELWTQLLEHVKTAPTPEERQFPYLPLNESMYWDLKIRLNPFTAVQTIRLHGNKFRTRMGTVFYAMQGPMEANSMHDDTRAEFLAMILIDKAEFIVFLGETNSCGHYFMEGAGILTIENFTVTTESEQQFQNSDIVVRTLKITDKKKKTQRKVKQFHVKNWKEGDIPNCGYEPLEAIMTEISKSKSPVVVHCTSGTGRTMSFIGMEYISRLLEANEEMSFADGFKKLSEKRYSAFESARQIGWMQVGVVYFMSIRFNTEMVMYRNIEGDFRDMVERNVGVPKGIKF